MKKTTRRLLFAFLTLITAGAHLAGKNHDWKVGTVQRSSSTRESLGGPSAIAIAQSSSGGGLAAASAEAASAAAASSAMALRSAVMVWQYLTIQGDGYVFEVGCLLRRHRPAVTVHGPIKYALEKGGRFYLQDEDGREFKMAVIEKVLTQPSTQKPAENAPPQN